MHLNYQNIKYNWNFNNLTKYVTAINYLRKCMFTNNNKYIIKKYNDIS